MSILISFALLILLYSYSYTRKFYDVNKFLNHTFSFSNLFLTVAYTIVCVQLTRKSCCSLLKDNEYS
ncbi:unnamed protein product [Allacma fusca]|uniref:Uncharacterized protein n=1 Tax=Allacma fusca TaxID=39272 RepID=A0A8J2J3F8_9HEXA|nr:unnamed protein product [Allacma fusca]